MAKLETSSAMQKLKSEISANPNLKDAFPIIERQNLELVASRILDNVLHKGEKAPDFILPNVDGKGVELYSILKEKSVVLVFYRGVWCPYCSLYLHGLQKFSDDLTRLNAQIVAVSPQLPDGSVSMQQKAGLTYPVLSDVGNVVARKYGLVWHMNDEMANLQVKLGVDLEVINGNEGGYELPIPATFLINKKGIITLSEADIDPSKRIDPEEIVVALVRQLAP